MEMDATAYRRLDDDINLHAAIETIRAEYGKRSDAETPETGQKCFEEITARIVQHGYGPIERGKPHPAAGDGRLFVANAAVGGAVPLPRWLCDELLHKLADKLEAEGKL